MGALLLCVIPRDKTPLGRLGRLGAAPEVPQQGGGSWVLAGDEIQRVLTWHWGAVSPLLIIGCGGLSPFFSQHLCCWGWEAGQELGSVPPFPDPKGAPWVSVASSSIPEQRRWHQGVLRARSLERRRCCCEDGNKRKVTLLYLLVFYPYCFRWIAPSSRPGW